MKKFIHEIVDMYLEKAINSSLTTCIITPNRRAHRFIKEAIIQALPNGGFMPGLFTIDDFIFNHIPMIRLDEVDLTYILFDIFKNQENSEFDFEDFLNYSSILLHDFNEIDMQLADGRSIFSYLSEAKAIQQWNPDGSPLSLSQKEYLRFYNQLAFIYKDFKEKLLVDRFCFQGMAYRYFSENLEEITAKLSWKHLIFAGFNALTKSEEQMLKKWSRMEMVSTVWDSDAYYLNDEMMEAGLYLRNYRHWNSDIDKQAKTHFLNLQKGINIIGTPGVLGQVRMAAQIITSKFAENPNFLNDSVIVPADEQLLVPLLNSLPAQILKGSNITMGFPLQHSHAYRLAESLIRLHLQSTRLGSINQKQSRFHKDNLLEVWNNELLKILNPNLHVDSKDILQNFVSPEKIIAILAKFQLEYLEIVFHDCENKPPYLLRKLDFLFQEILNKSALLPKENQISAIEKDAIDQILKVFNRLEILVDEQQKPNTIQGFYVLYRQLIQGLSQPFEGDIHKGLQIMGLLETRLMDFENVMILSTNEDILPASSFSNSFIPADIRGIFELPGIKEKTAVFAYHFYRLIQRAQNVYLIYSTTKKKLSGGEKSRFIKQLEFELQNYNPNIRISLQLLNFSEFNSQRTKEIIIDKSESIMERLEKLAQDGISPTKVITYIRCPLQFYFKHIAKIKEVEQAEDQIDERVIGNVIHQMLEDFYKPFIGTDFPNDKLENFSAQIPDLIPKYFAAEFKGKLDEGANYLALKDTEYYLAKFIEHEIAASKKSQKNLKILSIEEVLERTMTLPQDDKITQVLVKGKADRIDQIGQTIRILDYKTGSVDLKKVKLPANKEAELNQIFSNSEYDKTTQLFIYDWMYKLRSTGSAQAGIVSFRLIKNPYILMQFPSEDEYESLEEDFKELLSQIFDSKTPFTQTEKIADCGYCDFRYTCSRKEKND